MMFGHDRRQLRLMFIDAWEKSKEKKPLSSLEEQIVTVIQAHEEYHALFNQPEAHLEKNYFTTLGESNPFLHMSMHLAVREHVSTDRPQGIQAQYQRLLKQYAVHDTEHKLMEALEEVLSSTQPADEMNYLTKVRTIT